MVVDRACVNCLVVIDGRELPADLHVISMKDYNAILGKDWLSSTYAVVNCHGKEWILESLVRQNFNSLGVILYRTLCDFRSSS